MKKLKKIFSVLLVFLVLMLTNKPQMVEAAQVCSSIGINISTSNIKETYYSPDNISFTVENLIEGEDYHVMIATSTKNNIIDYIYGEVLVDKQITANLGRISFSTDDEDIFIENTYPYYIYLSGPGLYSCVLASYNVVTGLKCDQVKVYQTRGDKQCFGGPEGYSCLQSSLPVTIESKLSYGNGQPYQGNIIHEIVSEECDTCDDDVYSYQDTAENGIAITEHRLEPYTYRVVVREDRTLTNPILCEFEFDISTSNCEASEGSSSCNETPPPMSSIIQSGLYSLCNQIPSAMIAQRESCVSCVGGSNTKEGDEGVWTALGCIKKEPTTIIRQLINIGLGMAGGFTLLTFLAAGFSYTTAQGDVKKVTEAREQITAALVGLLFIIFSVTILQFVGTTVLKIPGFGG